MDRARKFGFFALAFVILGTVPAFAQDEKKADEKKAEEKKADEKKAPDEGSSEAAPPSEGGVSAEVKAAKGIEKRDPVDEATEFAVGDTVYVWSKITGGKGTAVKHVWKKDDKTIWTVKFGIRGNAWRMNSRKRALRAGTYTVEVVNAADGEKLGEVTFTVQ